MPLLAAWTAGCLTVGEGAVVRSSVLERVRQEARAVTGSNADYDELLDAVGESGFVLLGEATHGASEFYSERARMTRRLVENKGFTVVIIEANWPDAYDVNEFIHGRGPARVEEALATFDRFPGGCGAIASSAHPCRGCAATTCGPAANAPSAYTA